MYGVLFIASYGISIAAAAFLYKKKKRKGICILLAFTLNTLLLGSAFTIMYLSNDEMRIFGIGDSKIYYLIGAIPIITWVNALTLLVMDSKAPAA